MAIELQTSDSQLVKTTGTSSVTGNSSNGITRPGGTFGEVLSTQAALFKVEDGKQGLNTAKLLSPDVAHANQLLNQSKTYSQSNAKSIQTFEANINQAAYILAMKNVAEYKQSAPNTSPLSAVNNFAQNISLVGGSGFIQSAAVSATSVAPRNINPLNQKIDHSGFQIARSITDETDEAESLVKADGHSEFFKDSAGHGHSQHQSQDSEEPSPEELQAMGALAINSGQHIIQDMTSSASGAIQLQMQSSMSSPEWIAELAQKTVVMFGSDKHTAVIVLNSSDKGSLKIILHINGDQVNASFYSNDSDVLQALQMGVEDLKSSMIEAGLVLSQLNVSSGSSYPQAAITVQNDSAAFDNKLDVVDLHLAKMVNFYV